MDVVKDGSIVVISIAVVSARRAVVLGAAAVAVQPTAAKGHTQQLGHRWSTTTKASLHGLDCCACCRLACSRTCWPHVLNCPFIAHVVSQPFDAVVVVCNGV